MVADVHFPSSIQGLRWKWQIIMAMRGEISNHPLILSIILNSIIIFRSFRNRYELLNILKCSCLDVLLFLGDGLYARCSFSFVGKWRRRYTHGGSIKKSPNSRPGRPRCSSNSYYLSHPLSHLELQRVDRGKTVQH